jgi:hypothetical protein
LPDFPVRYIAMAWRRLGMAVHLVRAIAGSGSYFSADGTNPLLLAPLFKDVRLRKTDGVLSQGG